MKIGKINSHLSNMRTCKQRASVGCTENIRLPPCFLAVLQELHDGMLAIVAGGLESKLFTVLVGIKQGCALAPLISIIFFVAVTMASQKNISEEDYIRIRYWLDGNLFNQR